MSSAEEVAYIREAIRSVDFGREQVVERVRPGVDEASLCDEVRLAMMREAQLDADIKTICVVQQASRRVRVVTEPRHIFGPPPRRPSRLRSYA